MDVVFNTVEYDPAIGVTQGWRNPDIPSQRQALTAALAPAASLGVDEAAAPEPPRPPTQTAFNVLPSTDLPARSDDDTDLFDDSPSDTE